MIPLIRLNFIKSKKVPLLITGIVVIVFLWILTIKALVEPASVIHTKIDLDLVNFGLLIYIIVALYKGDSSSKGGFILRLPVSDLEIIAANIISILLISIATILLSISVSFLFVYFFKLIGFKIAVSTDKLTIDSLTFFIYATMYMGIIFSTYTLIQQYTSKSTAKLILIGTPVALLFLVPTLMAIFYHSTHINITPVMWNQLWQKPLLAGIKKILSFMWKLRLILGFIYIFLVYKVRYLREV